MTTLKAPPPAYSVTNRLLNRRPFRQNKVGFGGPEDRLFRALLAVPIEVALTLVVLFLWPLVFVASILLLVVAIPFVAVIVGVTRRRLMNRSMPQFEETADDDD